MRFASLSGIPWCRHDFIGRVPEVNVVLDKREAILQLEPFHSEARAELGEYPYVTAEQVHGAAVAVVETAEETEHGGVDGLVTNLPGVTLGIYVADCAAVYLVDPLKRAIGLVHSGKKGTELGIVDEAIEQLQQRYGSKPDDLVVQISPCIRPPEYEVDFAASIREQCAAAGVRNVNDCGICTASNPEMFYSYRREKGRTGRMLALLAISE